LINAQSVSLVSNDVARKKLWRLAGFKFDRRDPKSRLKNRG